MKLHIVFQTMYRTSVVDRPGVVEAQIFLTSLGEEPTNRQVGRVIKKFGKTPALKKYWNNSEGRGKVVQKPSAVIAGNRISDGGYLLKNGELYIMSARLRSSFLKKTAIVQTSSSHRLLLRSN